MSPSLTYSVYFLKRVFLITAGQEATRMQHLLRLSRDTNGVSHSHLSVFLPPVPDY